MQTLSDLSEQNFHCSGVCFSPTVLALL